MRWEDRMGIWSLRTPSSQIHLTSSLLLFPRTQIWPDQGSSHRTFARLVVLVSGVRVQETQDRNLRDRKGEGIQKFGPCPQPSHSLAYVCVPKQVRVNSMSLPSELQCSHGQCPGLLLREWMHVPDPTHTRGPVWYSVHSPKDWDRQMLRLLCASRIRPGYGCNFSRKSPFPSRTEVHRHL